MYYVGCVNRLPESKRFPQPRYYYPFGPCSIYSGYIEYTQLVTTPRLPIIFFLSLKMQLWVWVLILVTIVVVGVGSGFGGYWLWHHFSQSTDDSGGPSPTTKGWIPYNDQILKTRSCSDSCCNMPELENYGKAEISVDSAKSTCAASPYCIGFNRLPGGKNYFKACSPAYLNRNPNANMYTNWSKNKLITAAGTTFYYYGGQSHSINPTPPGPPSDNPQWPFESAGGCDGTGVRQKCFINQDSRHPGVPLLAGVPASAKIGTDATGYASKTSNKYISNWVIHSANNPCAGDPHCLEGPQASCCNTNIQYGPSTLAELSPQEIQEACSGSTGEKNRCYPCAQGLLPISLKWQPGDAPQSTPYMCHVASKTLRVSTLFDKASHMSQKNGKVTWTIHHSDDGTSEDGELLGESCSGTSHNVTLRPGDYVCFTSHLQCENCQTKTMHRSVRVVYDCVQSGQTDVIAYGHLTCKGGGFTCSKEDLGFCIKNYQSTDSCGAAGKDCDHDDGDGCGGYFADGTNC